MTRHLDEGVVLAARDGAAVPPDALEHLEACSVCGGMLRDAKTRADLIGAALDGPMPDLDVVAAKTRVRASLDRKRDGPPRFAFRIPLGRAAALLLIGCGAAYALPGSPVRDWLDGPEQDVVPAEAAAPAVTDQEPAEAGIEMALSDGLVEIAVDGVNEGEDVRLRWIDEPVLRVVAPPGSRYAMAEGRAEADVTEGPVRIELSRGARARVRVNGRTILEGSFEAPVLDGASTAGPDEIVFEIRER